MVMSSAYRDREQDKFIESIDGKTAVRIIPSEDGSISLIDTANVGVIYIGTAPRSSTQSLAVWTITKIDTSTSVISIKNSPANSVWNDRASLVYE